MRLLFYPANIVISTCRWRLYRKIVLLVQLFVHVSNNSFINIPNLKVNTFNIFICTTPRIWLAGIDKSLKAIKTEEIFAEYLKKNSKK